ncbi:hypothetical protein Fmac_000164 [Flemingia macrophylla]|uniref:S-protein homolog n=1 Tax=Flemingia macrophylla TaxID=520843 RepID=A0ABD1NDH4_9FABA
MSSSSRSVLFCLLTLLSSNSVLGFGFGVAKTHVRITNTLEGGLDLTVHCKSKDDDIGEQHLHSNAFFDFQFATNIFGTTLFYCSFQWEDNFQWFDIYVEKRDGLRCDDCFWNVQQDGPCFLAKDKSVDCYYWKK